MVTEDVKVDGQAKLSNSLKIKELILNQDIHILELKDNAKNKVDHSELVEFKMLVLVILD